MQYYITTFNPDQMSSLPKNLYRYSIHIDERALKYIHNQTRELVDIAIETTPSIREETFIKIKKKIIIFISHI